MIRASMRKSSSSCSEHTSGSVWHRGEEAVSGGSEHWPRSGLRGSPSYLYSHLQGARVAGHSRHLTFIHLPKRTMAQTPAQRRRKHDEAEAGRL